MSELTTTTEAVDLLREVRTVAVLGATDRRFKAGFYVPEYLRAVGYRVYGVNPARAGQVLWGEPVVATLVDVPVSIDLIDVFRRSEHLPGHVDQILAMDPRPRAVWFQLGIRNDAVAQVLVDAGLDVVQSRCTLADHRAYLA